MKIAFPTQENKGIESRVHGHFGSAHYFVVVDTEEDSTEIIDTTPEKKGGNHAAGGATPRNPMRAGW